MKSTNDSPDKFDKIAGAVSTLLAIACVVAICVGYYFFAVHSGL